MTPRRNEIRRVETKTVGGWNEIDAVELVGRDGSRQWATAATASSSYPDRLGSGGELLFVQPRFR